MIDIRRILEVMPHRYPFLLVDRILEVEPGRRIVGLKNVTINEPFFPGHFPGAPVMPGVLIIETMAQVAGLMLMDTIPDPQSKLLFFLGIDNARFRRPVVPGDQLRCELELVQARGQTFKVRGQALVDGAVVAEAEMLARVTDR